MKLLRNLSLALCLGLLPLGAGVVAFAQPGVERLDTEYNSIVLRRSGSQVSLGFRVGRCEFVESVKDLSRPETLVVEYTRASTAALAYPARLGSVLEIGVGGGTTLMYLHRHLPKTHLTGVEIDSGVIELARKHFGLLDDARLSIVINDGRKHIANSTTKHDLILVDAYRGTWVPETLTSVEFFQLLKSRLHRGGAVAQNVEPSTLFFDGLAATLAAVFEHVDAYPTQSFGAPGNVVLVAYDGPRKGQAELLARAEALQKEFKFTHPLPAIVATGRPVEFEAGAQPLYDDRAAANTLLMIDKANARDTPRARKARCE